MRKKGISLIVLIITIIVVIILAAVVILTLTQNNPIESAKEARFKEDVRTFKDELALTVSKQYTTAGGHRDEKISTLDFDKIKEYIPSFSEKYRNKFIIQDDDLRYTKQLDDKEKEYAKNLNVKEKYNELLPIQYQQVEYLESTGKEYINTNFYTTNNTKIDLIMQLNSINGDQKFLGSYGAGGICLGVLAQKWRIGGYSWGGRGSNGVCNIAVNSEKINIVAYQNTWIINEEQIICTNSISTNTQAPIALFGVFYNGKIFQKNAIKVYNLKIYNNEDIERNYIPCYSITPVIDVDGNECPSGTKGMYDTVEGKFYTNQGTGEFIVGLDVD